MIKGSGKKIDRMVYVQSLSFTIHNCFHELIIVLVRRLCNEFFSYITNSSENTILPYISGWVGSKVGSLWSKLKYEDK